MKKNSTFVCKLFILFTIFSLSFNGINAQNCTAPAMTWKSPVLVSGTAGQPGAKYKFSNVTTGVYALISIEGLINGATLTNIDDSIFGYQAAWQPVIKTPAAALTTSYIKFKIEFYKNLNDNPHTYGCFQLSFIDVDGDNVGVKEFVAAKDPQSYTVSTNTLLTMSTVSGLVKAQGPLVNFTNIDTSAYQTNINYKYVGKNKVEEIWIGNTTLATFTVQDRFACGYFAQISMPLTPLPVTYLSFDAVVNDKSVLLKWLTAQENNNSHFEVERSFDMNIFNSIGLVLDGFAVNGTGKSYQFKDNSSELQNRSIVYYRLKQFDIDGKVTYSKVLAVRLQVKTDVTMQVSPNPFIENLTARFNSSETGNAQIRIMNLAGQTMLSKQSTISKGYNNIQIDGLNGLATGVYVAQLILNGTVIDNQKVIKN